MKNGKAEMIRVCVPTERAIYQRNCENMADINISVQYEGTGELKAKLMEHGVTLGNEVSLQNTGDSHYTGKICHIPAGGWYTLMVTAVGAATKEIEETALVEKVGVGDVFITGGQSNSCNFGSGKTKAVSDKISAYDPNTKKWQHCEDSQPSKSGFHTGNGGGSPWPSMGDALTEKTGLPVGFVSTGVGSAKIEELRTMHYFAIRDAIKDLSPYGYRAFLLHQGEADTDETAPEDYRQSLQSLIAQTREDAGYNLPWYIAQVSYAWSNYNNTEKMEQMKQSQRQLCNGTDIFEGPTTDDLQGEYRHKEDNLHMSKLGLLEHGKRWAEVIWKTMNG